MGRSRYRLHPGIFLSAIGSTLCGLGGLGYSAALRVHATQSPPSLGAPHRVAGTPPWPLQAAFARAPHARSLRDGFGTGYQNDTGCQTLALVRLRHLDPRCALGPDAPYRSLSPSAVPYDLFVGLRRHPLLGGTGHRGAEKQEGNGSKTIRIGDSPPGGSPTLLVGVRSPAVGFCLAGYSAGVQGTMEGALHFPGFGKTSSYDGLAQAWWGDGLLFALWWECPGPSVFGPLEQPQVALALPAREHGRDGMGSNSCEGSGERSGCGSFFRRTYGTAYDSSCHPCWGQRLALQVWSTLPDKACAQGHHESSGWCWGFCGPKRVLIAFFRFIWRIGEALHPGPAAKHALVDSGKLVGKTFSEAWHDEEYRRKILEQKSFRTANGKALRAYFEARVAKDSLRLHLAQPAEPPSSSSWERAPTAAQRKTDKPMPALWYTRLVAVLGLFSLCSSKVKPWIPIVKAFAKYYRLLLLLAFLFILAPTEWGELVGAVASRFCEAILDFLYGCASYFWTGLANVVKGRVRRMTGLVTGSRPAADRALHTDLPPEALPWAVQLVLCVCACVASYIIGRSRMG